MTRPLSDLNHKELADGIEAGVPLEEIKLTPMKAKKARNNEESRAQRQVIKWFDFYGRKTYRLPNISLFSVPNGGFRSIVTASIMKSEGQRRGVFDLFLTVPRNGKSGLYLEMKAEHGVLSKEQVEFKGFVETQGYATAVCRTANSAIAEIEKYLT